MFCALYPEQAGRQKNIELIFIFRILTTNAFLQDMEYLRQSDYNTEILRVVSVSVNHWHWTTARGTCTCTGRVTAQGDKDTMTTMVVVIVDDGDQYDDY